ncbi:MAG: hypothetical protein HFI37_08085, partial [Lachnospiraceae bacterium]|nr:hypothetical protein [Lachnospiraceae bacterium]
FDRISATLDGENTNIYGGSFHGNEYHIVLSLSEKTDSIIGKKIQVKLTDLCDSEKTKLTKIVDENWDLTWTLEGSREIKTYEFSEKLGDSSATLTGAEISPISLNLTFQMPRTTIKETYIDAVTKEEGITETYAEPPFLAGIRMKDGALYTILFNGGHMGYRDDTSDIYEVSIILNRILDVSNIDSLLFLKEGVNLDSESEITEDLCYSVPVK